MSGVVTTIRDVARAAGCSIATVSRVSTGSVPVSDATRQRVIAAALTLNFPLGRSGAASRAVLGVLVPSLTNPVFAAALAGIERCARLRGVSTVIAQSHYLPDGEEDGVRVLMAERPRGLILTVCDPAASRALMEIAAQRLPAATIYNVAAPDGVGSVAVDNRAAMTLVVRELLDAGHTRILFLAGRFASSDRSAARHAGYRDALLSRGIRPLPPLEVDFIDAAQDIDLTAALDRHRPTAIAASNDLLAVSTIASLDRMGLSVPRDLSVTGFDGMELATLVRPRLTTIAQPSTAMGMLAASMVLDMAAGVRGAEALRVDASLLRGGTVGPAPAASSLSPSTHLPTTEIRSPCFSD